MPVISLKMDISALKSGANQASSTLDAIAKKADSASASTDRLSSSIASAAKQVLALVGAYKALEGMKGFVQRGIEFNSTIEQSRIGMASLIATMAKLQDEQGRTLEGAEKYAAAQSVAADMMKEIQRLGLETTATTQELVQGVQNVMGAAMNAGLKLEQIPKFAVTAAQAMQAMGIPLVQMRTEIEALLTGNINGVQDLLAPRLEIDKATIESWRQQGILYDKLMEKMAAFEQAGKDVAQTWRGLTSNFSEAMDVLAGQSAQGISENLKTAVSELQDLILTTGDGAPRISENFEQIAKVIIRIEDALGGSILSAAQGFASAVRGINDAIGEMGGTEALWGRTETAIATVSAALASLTVVRKAGVAESIKASQQEIAAYEQSEQAAHKEAQAKYEAAKASREAAAEEARLAQLAVGRAEERVVQTKEIANSAVTIRQQTRALSQQSDAWRELSVAQEKAKSTSASLNAADRALAKAEATLQATTFATTNTLTVRDKTFAASSALWARAVDGMVAGATKLGSALKSLWAGLGGGVGVAITAITAGITYLATRQDDAARATELHTQAQKDYEAVVKSAADETGKLSGKLSELEKQRLAAAKTKAGEAYQLQMKELSDAIDAIIEKQERLRSVLADVGVESGGGLVPSEYLDTLKGMMALLETGSMSVDEFQEQLANLRSVAVEAGYGNSEFVKTLDQINAKGGVADTLLSIAKTLGLVSSNAREAASGIREASAAANSIKGLDEALKQSEFVKFTGKLSAEQRSAASFLEKTVKLSKDQITAAMSGDFSGFSVEDAKKIRAIISNVSSGKSGGSASSIQSAQRSIAELRREIEQMQGSSTKTVSDLAKKFEDIAKAGKSAGLSAEQVSKLQQEYKDAFQAKTLKDFNKELLQVQGNTTALKNIQIAETLRGWTQQFQAAGMTAEQYAPKIEELQNALKEQQEFKDLKVAADFYKELADLSGSYGKSLALQNRLIKEQAKNWERAGIPLEDIAERVRLMVLDLSQDPFDGAYRGLLKFSAEYADSGKQWEKISYSFAGNFQSATREMFDNFLDTGRVSFASLERSFATLLKDMAYQALVQPVVLSIVGGVQQGVYGMTTAGGGGSGMGLNSLTGLPVSSILPESVTSGISGITGTVLPGTHVAGLMGPTTSGAALSGGLTIGSALGYGAFGGLGYSLLGGALGLPQNTYTGVTSSLGGALGAWGGAALGSTGALAGSIIGSALPFVGTALGALAGGLIGGLFGGGGDKDPWVNISSWVDLLGTIEQKDPYQARSYRTSGTGYEITANQGEGISWETGKQLADMAASLAQEAIQSVATFRESVAAIGNEALTQQFETALEQNRYLKHWYEWEDREVKPEELTEDFNRAIQEKLYLSLSAVDLTSLTTAADGAIADTIPEIAKAITDSVNFVALGANLGEYQDDFNAAISGKLLDALNQIDTSGIALDVDKSSLAGWEAAAKALQAWDEVDTALTAILDPASELETTMSAAQGQFDGWLATLRKLGWQEEAVAGIEAKRASVLQSYASSLTRAVEEDLALRSLSLRYGSDSGEYGLRSLQYRQQTELDELRKKLGEDSDLYQTMVQTQQAETTKYRIDLLEKELEDALAAEEQSRTRQASAMLSAAKSAEKLRDDMKKIAESFADARRDIWNSPADDLPGSSYLSSLASFDDAYLKALKGDEDALRDLPNLASGLLELGRENLATSEEYSDLFYDVDKKLKHVQESAQNGLIKGQSAQIDAITSQTGTLQAAINAGTAAGEYTGRSVDAIRAELEALQKLLAQQTAAITSAGSTTRREDLLQAKVEQLNKSGYQGRRDWTISGLQNYMAAKNLTVEAWYDRYGRNENLGVKYDSAAARRDLLQRKADAMNAGRTLAGGQEAGGWTADRVEAAIKADGMTVDEWYLRFGRAEGFASGGITPVGRPFWVGERGPELMMGGSPHRVWSHTDSMALVERGRGGWDMTALLENGRGVLRELRSLNSRIARLEKYTRDTSDAVTRASVLGWTVTQEATA